MAKLYFYYSSMNAGKSTALLQSSYNYKERGMNTLVMAPFLDDRYGPGKVTSRIGIETDALIFQRDDDLYAVVEKHCGVESLHCVLIDEAQFLTRDQVFQLSDVTDNLNIPVLAYGAGVTAGPLGKRESFADIGQSLASFFNLAPMDYGTNFLK
jgi:thymidine kinase